MLFMIAKGFPCGNEASFVLSFPILPTLAKLMKNLLTRPLFHVAVVAASIGGLLAWNGQHNTLEASSHREAPLIADDPLADNTDLYAFRSPDAAANDANATVTIIANYIPLELPQGGPIYNTFGENIRYEIHVKNSATTTGDDIIYRFTFTKANQDPSTFFRVRLGQENQKTTYMLEEIRGASTTVLVAAGAGVVPPPNIGPRSIQGAAGLGAANYEALMTAAVRTLGNGMKVFCGPTDDPFFVDLGAIFDLGGVRPRQNATGPNAGTARDGVARKNTHAIAMQIPVRLLQATSQNLTTTTNILDSNFIIGVWASASRQAIRTINANGTQTHSGGYVQVSRLGMPLTNEVVTPIGDKDVWNAGSPFSTPLPAAGTPEARFDDHLMNPELGLYMATGMANGQTYYGAAVPGLTPLRIQSRSLAGTAGLPANGFDFRNGAAGLSGLIGNAGLAGTALAPIAQGGYGEYLLRAGKPRSVDLLPIFHTGVPNLRPYQLATGKNGNPLAAGKPFINNFLPTFGDMLRLNMAVPPTPRNSPDFSSEGLLAAAVLGLTDTRFNGSTAIQNIPNMDGFPNGRRLEDDVTRIELQAVSGIVLAAIGLWYDDYVAGSANPVTPQLGGVLTFSTNIERNDTTLRAAFPYSQTPWSGTNAQTAVLSQRSAATGFGLQPQLAVIQGYPNPFVASTTFHFDVKTTANLSIVVSDMVGRRVATVARDKAYRAGEYEVSWAPGREVAPGQYIATLYSGSTVIQSVRLERQ
jgi:hypothetical protein